MNIQLINKRKQDEYEGTVRMRSEYRKYRSLALTQNINKKNYSVDDSELEQNVEYGNANDMINEKLDNHKFILHFIHKQKYLIEMVSRYQNYITRNSI